MKERLKPYKKTFDYSYASGAFAVYELIEARPENILYVYIHPDFNDDGGLEGLCAGKSIPVIKDGRAFQRIGQKENSMVFAVFSKYESVISADCPHVTLVNPGDMGNLGAIIRTMTAFSVTNLAVITPAADIFDPRTVRASMGALFRIKCRMFGSFEDYAGAFPEYRRFMFMTDGETVLSDAGISGASLKGSSPPSLVFGNEATGLPPLFKKFGTGVRIPQTGQVDSLNLAAAAAIGLYVFFGL